MCERRSISTSGSGPGGRFSKVTKLFYGPFSGVTIPFVSQKRNLRGCLHGGKKILEGGSS